MTMLLPIALLLSSTVIAPGPEGEPDLELSCEVGPVDRTYAGNAWEVYSCDDGKSVVVVAKREAKAHPFYFIVTPAGEGVRLYGEGDGDRAASRAAFSELNAFTPADVAALVAATRARPSG